MPARWEWTSFDLTKSQKLTGVVKETKWERDQLATAKIEIAGKTYDVMLGFPVRLEFRRLVVEDVKPGVAITIEAVPSKQNPNDLRAQIITVGKETVDAR